MATLSGALQLWKSSLKQDHRLGRMYCFTYNSAGRGCAGGAKSGGAAGRTASTRRPGPEKLSLCRIT